MDRNTLHLTALRIAIKWLDPDRSLVPGAQDYEDVEAMVTNWFSAYGRPQTLEMIMDCMEHLEGSKKPERSADLG